MNLNENPAYQEPFREELINGEIVRMLPVTTNHSLISGNIYYIFGKYLKGKKIVPFSNGMDIFLTEKDRFIPDDMVVCDLNKIKEDGVHGAPDLVVEILSPSTIKNDRRHKMEVYAQCGVREYWIVSPASRMIEQYLLDNGKMVLSEVYSVYPDYMLEHMSDDEKAALITEFRCSLFDDLTIQLADIFENTFEDTF